MYIALPSGEILISLNTDLPYSFTSSFLRQIPSLSILITQFFYMIGFTIIPYVFNGSIYLFVDDILGFVSSLYVLSNF